MILNRDKSKGPDVEKIYETEHNYIDFSYTIIGEKVKRINDIK